MFNVCSYCQEYQGEVQPLRNFAVTHGCCAKCRAAGCHLDTVLMERAREIIEFYAVIRSSAVAGAGFDVKSALEKAEELGLSMTSLLMLTIQPILYEIGEKFSQGEVSIATEHAFIMFCESLLHHLGASEFGDPLLNATAQHDRLVVCADGNNHSLGSRFLSFFLKDSGIPVFMVYPGLPVDEVLNLIETTKPKTLGVSVSMANQKPFLTGLASGLRDLSVEDTPAKIVVGGFVFRNTEPFEIPEGMQIAPAKLSQVIQVMT